MHFIESTDKEVAFKNSISDFSIPFDIKNDIVYCQKSFRIYLKIHKMVITRYGELIPTLPKIKKLMADLEREIYQINAEQKFLIIRLRRCLEDFYNSINKHINIDRDFGTNYINLIFSKSIDHIINDCTLLPITVKKRRSLEQLMLKFGLTIHDSEKLSTSTSPSSLLSNSHTLSTPSTLPLPSEELQQIMERIEPNKSEKIHLPPQSNDNEPLKWLSNTPENLILKQVSLLKPKSERSCGNENDNQIEFNNIKSESPIEYAQNNEEMVKVENKTVLTTEQQTVPKVSMSINTGRINLLQALYKAKCQNQQSVALVSTPAPTRTNPKTKLMKFKKMPLIVSNSKKSKDDYQNCKPSTSKIKNKSADNSVPQSSASSDDSSSDGIKNYPLFEKELPEPTEYNQEMFLRLFGLNTLAHSIYLQQRRSKRRRRNVQSNERKDFHYGNLDITQNVAEKEKKKKIFLASPTANRNLKRKQIERKYKHKGRSSLSPEDKILCNQCSKNGDQGLSRCDTCRGYFHAKCHKGAFLKKPLQIREKICPSCYKANKSRSTSTDEQSRNSNNTSPNEQISLLKQLHGKLNTARSRKSSLLKESEIFKTKMNELFTIVDTIKKEDSDNDNEINNKDIQLNTITNQLKCQETLIDDLKCDELINDDNNKESSNNKIYSEEQNKFDQIMMLIHDNSDLQKTDDYDEKSENLYEIYDSEISNQDYDDNNDDDDVIMIIDQSGCEGDESIYEIQENSHDSTDVEMIE